MSNVREMLIATVGLSPQVVTLALDELLRRGIGIRRVIIVQPTEAHDGIRMAIEQLRVEEPFYQNKYGITFEFCVFEGMDKYRPADTVERRDAEAVLQTLHREIGKAKEGGWRVHLSIAGGRKIISAFGTVAAQFHFESEDRCWHLVEGMQSDRAAMHVREDEATILVDVPILSWKLWKRVISGSLSLALTDDPIQTEQMLRHLENNVEHAHRLREFYLHQLTHTEQRVLALLFLEGLSNTQLEKRLDCSGRHNVSRISQKYSDFIKGDADDRRLIADFQQILLALQFQGKLPDLTREGGEKPTPSRTKRSRKA